MPKKFPRRCSSWQVSYPTATPQVPEDANLFLNRELSLLSFFRRVLEEALDERNPLLERAKFLAIVGTNLAEFFMVRVAGLKQQIESGVIELSIDGLTPAQQLAAVRQAAKQLMSDARDCLPDFVAFAARSRNSYPRFQRTGSIPEITCQTVFRRHYLPHPDAACLRSGTAFPAHIEHELEPGGSAPGGRREAAASQG